MDAPISLAERNRINAENRAKYEAAQQQAAADKLARKAANQEAQKARQRRMNEASCGSVEQTGNPRRGCDCKACTRRRAAKNGWQRKVRERSKVDDRDENWDRSEYRAERFARYGLTEATYFDLLKAQGGKCAICDTDKPGGQGKNRPSGWHIDHDHKTGRVRGLLCHKCNVGLGHFQDSIDTLKAAIKYLED